MTIVIANACSGATCAVDTAIGRSAVGLFVPYNAMVSDFAGYGRFTLADEFGNYAEAICVLKSDNDILSVIYVHVL